MPDRRVPRPGGQAVTVGGEGTEYPLNDGGVLDYRDEQKEQEKALEKQLKETEEDEEADEVGGFGVKPFTEVMSESSRRNVSEFSAAEHFLVLSSQDVLDFVYGDSELEQLMLFIQNNEEYSYNPPTRDEFGQMLKFAISRQGNDNTSKIEKVSSDGVKHILSAKKEYADRVNKAFPVDTGERTETAHAYIHKFWNTPSKRGIAASYEKKDFIIVHKKIVAAMKKYEIEHDYVDNLDTVSGITSSPIKPAKLSQSLCGICNTEVCQCKTKDQSSLDEEKGIGLFGLKVGQRVTSYTRGSSGVPGIISQIDGSIANVQWETGLITTQLLVSLIPA